VAILRCEAPRPTRHKLRRLAFTLASVLTLSGARILASNQIAIAASPLHEYEVKAVFLFNFTQFVEWPKESFVDASAPFVIGVLGHDPFGKALDDAVLGETVNGRRLIVQRYRTAGELKPCQILFIDGSVSAQASKALESLEHQGTLTVSDAETVGSRDVVIRFLEEDKRIRLRINVDSARSAGLTISSKLLRSARVVGTIGAG
jgi:hypothetical protein